MADREQLVQDVTVIIRTVGERSLAACRELLGYEVGAANVFEVSASPLSETLKIAYRLGLEQGRKWTLMVDADTLPFPDMTAQLYAKAQTVPEEAFEVQGLIYDKMFGIRRPAGNHFYRTSLMEKAIDLIPKDGAEPRPETSTLYRMMEAGHPWYEFPVVIGLHDFEQNYKDLFRTCYVQAGKHGELIYPLMKYWAKLAPDDPDYRVALGGLAAGVENTSVVNIDANKDHGFDRWMERAGITEKPPMEPGALTPDDIAKIYENHPRPDHPTLLGYEKVCLTELAHRKGVDLNAPFDPWTELNLFQKVPWVAGKVLCKIGRRLERLAGC